MISVLKRLLVRRREPAVLPPSPAASSEASPLRFCRDCKHRREISGDFDGCFAPPNLKVELVRGNKVRRLKYCETLRGSEGPYYCGADALWFEP